MLPFSADTRTANLSRMAEGRFDVLVIGGGITGAGIALDAAARGLSVALVEKSDFASGTSGRSSRLIHGGIRYLEQRDFALVRESLRERRTLLRLAPHLVRPLPVYMLADSPRSRALYQGGLAGYDLLAAGRNVGHHRPVRAEQFLQAAPGLAGQPRGYRYYECQTDDARLTIEVARTAQAYGALLANHARADGLLGGARVMGASVVDELTGQRFEIRARATVNASGVWADRVRGLAPGGQERLVPSKGVHVVFAPGAVRSKVAIFAPSAADDGRFIFLAPLADRVYAGTTDTPYSGDLEDPAADDSDRDYIVSAVARYFPGVTERDVVASWAGLRPLLSQEQAPADVKTRDLSRKHAVFEDPPGLFTITGGKLTTYRAMAEDLVDRFAGTLEAGPCRTRSIPLGLHGSAREALHLATAQVARLGLPARAGARLVQRYGDDWQGAVRLISADRSLGDPVVAGVPVLNVELELARSREMAITDEDVFVRRTRLTTLGAVLASTPPPRSVLARPHHPTQGSDLYLDRQGNDLERGRCGAHYLPVGLDREGRVRFYPNAAGAQFHDVAMRKVGAPVHLWHDSEGVGFRPHHDQNVECAVVRLGLGRDLHATAVEAAVRHHHVVPPPLEGLAVSVEAHGTRAEARQRQPEPAEVLGGPEEPWQRARPCHRRCSYPGLGDIGEVPDRLCRTGGAGDLAHIDAADTVADQAPGAFDGVPRQAKRLHQVASRAAGQHPEHGVRGDRPVIVQHPVDHLVDGPIAARRHQIALATLKGLAGGLRGMAGVSGPHDAVVKPGVLQHALDPGKLRPYRPSPGLRVGDDDHGAERAGHGNRTRGFRTPSGSSAALTLLSTSTPVSPSSVARNRDFSRPTPWWCVSVPPTAAQLRTAWSHAAR